VVDPQFGTVDVSVVVVRDLVTDRYFRHYSDDPAGSTDDASSAA
jgi:hypothetical protein